MRVHRLTLLAVCVTVCVALSPSTYLNTHDIGQLHTLFSKHLAARKDVASVYYAVLGMHALKKTVDESNVVCDFVKSALTGADSANIYMIVRAASLLPSCKIQPTKETVQLLESSLLNMAEKPGTQELYHVVESLAVLGRKIDQAAVSKLLTAALKTDESPVSLGYAFHIASRLSGSDVATFAERIEDAVSQADEVDSKYLQFDGGVGITSIVLTGIYKLCERVGRIAGISGDQVVKFTNYLVNRKTVQSLKAASHLVSALALFADNQFHVPLVISLISPAAMKADHTRLEVRVSDVLGGVVAAPLVVTADSVTRHSDDAVVVSQRAFNSPDVNIDAGVHVMDLQPSPASGFYTVLVSVRPKETASKNSRKSGAVSGDRYIGGAASLKVSVLTQVLVQQPVLAVVEADFSGQQSDNQHQLKPFEQLSQQLTADQNQRLLLSFRLTDGRSGEPLLCHQVFVRLELTNSGSAEQRSHGGVTLVVRPDDKANYKLDVTLEKYSSQLQSSSGRSVLLVQLMVGDAIIDNSFVWSLAELSVQFSGPAPPLLPSIHEPKPLIKHLFREPDVRASSTVSSVFTALVFVPLLIMLVAWLRVGLCFSMPSVSLASLGFIAGIGGIFTLYFYFWLQLNMFVTIKYLCALGLATFLCGHSALSRLAQKRKQQ